MNRKSIDSSAGEIEIRGEFAAWSLTVEQTTPQPDTELIRLRLESPSPAVPPHLVLTWSIHKIDTQISWCEGKWFSHNIPPDWCAYNHSSLASSLPLLLLANQQGGEPVPLRRFGSPATGRNQSRSPRGRQPDRVLRRTLSGTGSATLFL